MKTTITALLAEIKLAAAGSKDHARKAIELDLIKIEPGAIQKVAPYLGSKSYQKISIVADVTTFDVAGKQLMTILEGSAFSVYVTIIKPDRQGDVMADEASLIQLITDMKKNEAEVLIAVGGGTIHDIARYSAYISGVPFISVPTAPSVDGFNSMGAPVLLRGEKTTIPAMGPSALFADLDVLVKAPAALVAAGFGDMLGKYTSLFDWKFGSITAGEPYMQAAADITKSALLQCVEQVDLIAERQEEGIRTLMSALIESGLAMLLFGQSHPASGAEHHLSHYWEMEHIRLGKRQLLHGAKVGVASIEISRLYHRIAKEGAGYWRGVLSRGVPSSMAGAGTEFNLIAAHWEDIQREISEIPDEETLSRLLHKLGGPVAAEDLQINPELLNRSLEEAWRVRPNRFTLLRAYNERAFTYSSRSYNTDVTIHPYNQYERK
ncbi:sn-glycerol-1-phosphate dehydrogenase [Paenibacillus eucommiae]|uniref:Glycerol-1-phosphate dehydrogenase [NAD(P)+] n=1 Tax=Paenibacillus eucommiae TaxID=1355755 RepID=A0ABS4J9X2_9BACL|nr:sn-glycerol-1-phosphate dehydrogenase [Paenibacillus eucommiae]MBP1996633.1 glycerol-1-phosphate dehydrogenase [NAD(P)+] [Paenibacillus eucommiae]